MREGIDKSNFRNYISTDQSVEKHDKPLGATEITKWQEYIPLLQLT